LLRPGRLTIFDFQELSKIGMGVEYLIVRYEPMLYIHYRNLSVVNLSRAGAFLSYFLYFICFNRNVVIYSNSSEMSEIDITRQKPSVSMLFVL